MAITSLLCQQTSKSKNKQGNCCEKPRSISELHHLFKGSPTMEHEEITNTSSIHSLKRDSSIEKWGLHGGQRSFIFSQYELYLNVI